MHTNPCRGSWIGLGASLLLLAAMPGCAPQQRSPGAMLMEARRFEEAAAAYRARLGQDPQDLEARQGYDAARRAAASERHLRGQQLEKDYKLDAALGELALAVDLDPELEAARYDLSRLQRQRRLLARQIEEARATLQRGDCIAAKDRIDPIYAWLPTFSELEDLRNRAMKECFQREQTLARLFFELGNYAQAQHFLDQAEAYFPQHPEVAALRQRSEQAAACRQEMKQAADLLDEGDAPASAEVLRSVLDRCPDNADARQAWSEARRRGLGSALADGEKAVRTGSPLPALVAYRTALGLGIEDAELQSRVEELAAHYRLVVAARLFASAERDRAAGLSGSAMVRFRLADRLVPGFPQAAELASQMEQEASSLSPLVVAVLPPTNPTSYPWLGKELGAELARALQEALAGDSAIRVVEGYQDRPAVTVSGRIDEFAIAVAEPQIESRPMEALVGERKETNPALAEALTRSVQARRLLRDHPGDAAAMQAAQQAQQALAAVPPVRSQQVKTTIALPVARLAITGRARMQLTVGDREVGATLAQPQAAAEYRGEESIWQGFPAAGLEGHSGKLPTVEAVRRRLVLDLADKAKGEISRMLQAHQQQRLSTLARGAKGSEAIHYWAVALLAGGEPAAEAKEQLRQLTGYVHDGKSYDVRRISY